MKKTENESLQLSDYQSLKPRRSKSREVSSRFLSSPSHDNGAQSPRHGSSSPVRQRSNSDTRKHWSLEDPGFIRDLWPSSSSSQSSNNKNNHGTLADHLGNERLKDLLGHKKDERTVNNSNVFSLTKQKSSSTVFSRFENEKEKESTKENHRPILGGSTRYAGKLRLPAKSSSSSSLSSSSLNSLSNNNSGFVPGRFSIDENALYKNSKGIGASRRKSDFLADKVLESESEGSDVHSGTGLFSPTLGKSSRKSGIEVSSKYLNDVPTRSRRWTTDSNIQTAVSLDASPKANKLTIKNVIKRANSLTGYGSATSQWALSPGRSGSTPMSVESKERLMSFSTLKPPSTPSRPTGVEKLLNMGLDLFKGKKSSSSSSLFSGSENVENIHQLRLFHNRLTQWRYANARAELVNEFMNQQAENNLLNAFDGLSKLQHSVVQKKLQLQKEKLQLKLDFILQSQIKLLEAWGDMERQHSSSVSKTRECLHAVVCRVPLIEGAKVDPQSALVALRLASDLSASVKSALSAFSPSAEKTVSLLSQLAEVVVQEKLLIEECLELLHTVSELEIRERSLKGYIIQFNLSQQPPPPQQQQQQEQPQQHDINS